MIQASEETAKKQIGYKGCKLLNAAAHVGEEFYMLVVNEDAVISVVTGADATDYHASMALGANTLKQGTVLTITDAEAFEDITVDSGTVMGYNVIK